MVSNRRSGRSNRSSQVDDENVEPQSQRYSLDDDDDEVDVDEKECGSQLFGNSSQQCTQIKPEMTQDIQDVKTSDRNNLMALNDETREQILQNLTRLVLFKALAGQPIERSKCLKQVGASDKRITTAAFDVVAQRLQHTFNFELKRLPTYMETMGGGGGKATSVGKKYKDRYYMANGALDVTGQHSKAIQGVHESSAVEKGLLMIVLALIYCKGTRKRDGSRWLHDRILYNLLHRIDDTIPQDPPSANSKRGLNKATVATNRRRSNRSSTPNVDACLQMYVTRDYLLKERASGNDTNGGGDLVEDHDSFYAMGPRSAIEIGRRQLIMFCANLLDEEPDPSMLQEIQGDIVEEDDEEEG